MSNIDKNVDQNNIESIKNLEQEIKRMKAEYKEKHMALSRVGLASDQKKELQKLKHNIEQSHKDLELLRGSHYKHEGVVHPQHGHQKVQKPTDAHNMLRHRTNFAKSGK